MKKNRLIALISSITIAAAGVAAFVGEMNNKVNKVDAAETKRFYLNLKDFTGWDSDNCKFAINYFGGGVTQAFTSFMTAVSDDSNMYYADVPSAAQTVIFTRHNSGASSPTWDQGNKYNQTQNMTVGDSNCCKITGWDNSGTWDSNYNINQDYDYYLRGTFMPGGWDNYPGLKMDKNNDNEVKATINFKEGQEFIILHNSRFSGGESYHHKLKSGVDGVDGSWNDTKANVKANSYCKEGAHTIYFNHGSSDYGIWIKAGDNPEKDISSSLAQYVMVEDTVGQCETKFSVARTRFLAMDSSEQNAFKTSDAANRYESWARFLGENPYENSKASNSVRLNVIGDNNKTTIPVLFIVGLTGLSAIAGLFFYQKRKHN